MKRIVFLVIVLLVIGYIFNERFGTTIPSTKELQGSFVKIKDDLQESIKNVTVEIDKKAEEFKQTKEDVEDKIEKVENLVDAVNDLTE